MNRPQAVRLFAALMATSFALASCGGSSSDADDLPTEAETTTTADDGADADEAAEAEPTDEGAADEEAAEPAETTTTTEDESDGGAACLTGGWILEGEQAEGYMLSLLEASGAEGFTVSVDPSSSGQITFAEDQRYVQDLVLVGSFEASGVTTEIDMSGLVTGTWELGETDDVVIVDRQESDIVGTASTMGIVMDIGELSSIPVDIPSSEVSFECGPDELTLDWPTGPDGSSTPIVHQRA